MTKADPGSDYPRLPFSSLPEKEGLYDPRFERALKVGGRLFVTVGTGPVLAAQRVTRASSDDWMRESLFETGMPPLIHAAEPPRFVF